MHNVFSPAEEQKGPGHPDRQNPTHFHKFLESQQNSKQHIVELWLTSEDTDQSVFKEQILVALSFSTPRYSLLVPVDHKII